MRPILHRIYGLVLGVSRSIPGLPAWQGQPPPDVDVIVHWMQPPSGPTAVEWRRLHSSENVDDDGRPLFLLERAVGNRPLFRLSYSDGTTFWIRKGHPEAADEVWATWPDDLTSEDASTYFLGPVLGYLLRMRGQIVLHASAVGVPAPPGSRRSAVAVAFVGPSGVGKSTTAAAFARRGHPVLTEDACALAEPIGGEGPFHVVPGYPLIRLWGESVEMLYGSREALPLLTPTWDKRYLPLDETGIDVFHEEPLALRTIFLFGAREDSPTAPRVERVAPAEALIELVGNTYRNLVLDREQRADEFRGLHHLMRATPVCRIIPHADPRRLDDLLDLILSTAAPAPHE